MSGRKARQFKTHGDAPREVTQEALEALWIAQCEALSSYQKAHGPDAWGDSPSDLLARYQVGYRDGLRAALKVVRGY